MSKSNLEGQLILSCSNRSLMKNTKTPLKVIFVGILFIIVMTIMALLFRMGAKNIGGFSLLILIGGFIPILKGVLSYYAKPLPVNLYQKGVELPYINSKKTKFFDFRDIKEITYEPERGNIYSQIKIVTKENQVDYGIVGGESDYEQIEKYLR